LKVEMTFLPLLHKVDGVNANREARRKCHGMGCKLENCFIPFISIRDIASDDDGSDMLKKRIVELEREVIEEARLEDAELLKRRMQDETEKVEAFIREKGTTWLDEDEDWDNTKPTPSSSSSSSTTVANTETQIYNDDEMGGEGQVDDDDDDDDVIITRIKSGLPKPVLPK
ncbi:MAG: hypothetical protein AAF485_20055, partial [Chloroflexota bacterium]